jgi:hypothetical protein
MFLSKICDFIHKNLFFFLKFHIKLPYLFLYILNLYINQIINLIIKNILPNLILLQFILFSINYLLFQFFDHILQKFLKF